MIGAYGLDIARGAERDYTFEHKFGANPNLVSGTQTLWTQGGAYPWSALDNPQILYIKSTSASDTGSLTVYGLDADYVLQQETVTMTGLTAVPTQNTFKRIYRMIYSDSAANAGAITARTVSGTGVVVAHIKIGDSQTLMCVYTIPANTRAYGTQFTAGIGKGGDAEFKLYTRDFGGTFRIRAQLELYETTFTQTYSVPFYLPPKMDIDFRATTTGNNFPATGSFDLILDPV